MCSLNKILSWMQSDIQDISLPRCKTLAAIINGAWLVKGVGVPRSSVSHGGSIGYKVLY